MSRGLGRVELAILALIEGDEHTEVWTADDAAIKIYDGCTRSQCLTVLQAVHSLVRKHPDRIAVTGGKGRDPLWFSSPKNLERWKRDHL